MDKLRYKHEKDSMILWLNEQINETDIVFDAASSYFEKLIETLEKNPRIKFTGNKDYFKIRFLWILYKNSRVV
jgi:hypothetical protein